MASTILLDQTTWDLVLDVDGNIALAAEPYALGQDAASAAKTFIREIYWDTSVGVPYMTDILAKSPPLGLLKEIYVIAGLTVPGVAAAQCFITGVTNRALAGQLQVTPESGAPTQVADFTTVDPQV